MKTLHACVHVRVLGGTSIPPNVYAINTADTARKTPGCIFFDNSFVRGVISWHVDIKKNQISILRAAAVPDDDGTRLTRMTATLGYSRGHHG